PQRSNNGNSSDSKQSRGNLPTNTSQPRPGGWHVVDQSKRF
ncbi:unnamed protein product, partial [Rotaria socialis]